MEARDSGSRIRPLPVDDLDTDAPPTVSPGTKRRWAPLAVIAAGAMAFGIIATGLGPGEPDVASSRDAAPTTITADAPATTTTTEPPREPLGNFLPVALQGLELVTVGPSSAQIGVWNHAEAEPEYGRTVTRPRTASFNSDGSRLAVLTTVGGSRYVLSDAADNDAVRIVDATSGAWHATDPDLFAWTAADAEATIVRVADLSGVASSVPTALVEITLPAGQELGAWGDWGFATTDGQTTFAWDPDGVATRSATGVFFDASVDGTLLIANVNDGGIMPLLVSLDGSTTEIPSLEIGAADLQLTADGEWVLGTTFQQDGPTTILARAVNSRSSRITSIGHAATVLGTADNDRFLVLQELESNDLVFKDWSSGIEYRVPFGDDLGAVYLPSQSR